ncbi:glycosyltransferase family 4 protein [Acetobacter sp.]|jgi:glycosyltransferase involved in cell wall biosynthesis|uniref:glycosyltransferase family 4 protein n=1 Tax=Acetobacter sp. TaxID=440 RepID=UPI0025BBC5BA|nr:glycosyltransferase family 4 protein [Acetobacter sp.]MCH4091997.1 glycosyltransferase family 4 protein [Acetobacter sp.]MCI1301083.1 glycosyltransferase family 4 protein [Acetobacter sp.]MCI1317276.1 glycosyltransferase family 4 protein [Acetobacter sp.]
MTLQRKVVHVVVAGSIGGAERLLVDLATRPTESNAQHSVALMTSNPALRTMLTDHGIRVRDRGIVHDDPLSYLWRAFGPRDVRWLTGILQEENADIVHVHTYASHIIGVRAARRLHLPVLRTEHGIQHYTDISCSLFRNWALRHTNSIVAVSDYVRNFVALRAPFVRKHLYTIRNGVDSEYFSEHLPPSDKTPLTLALICRLEPWKGAHLLIKAVARVPGVYLKIAGDGSQRQTLEKLAISLGVHDRITFMGYQPDPRPVLASCHLAVNTSYDEPLGLSVMEALSMGRPVIAFRGGGIPEIVQNGSTGWLLDHRTTQALVIQISHLVDKQDLIARMGKTARAFIEDQGRIETMSQGYAQAYSALDSSMLP